jgi:hypothetical protein
MGSNNFSPSWQASFSYNPNKTLIGSNNKMIIGPEAIFSGVTGIASGIMGGIAQQQMGQDMVNAAAIQAQATRDAAFQNLLGGQYALTGAKQFDFAQQLKAADYKQAFFDPRSSQLQSEDRQRQLSDELSPSAQKLRWQRNTDQLNRTLAEKRAITDAMFGPVADRPFAYGNMPGYASVG